MNQGNGDLAVCPAIAATVKWHHIRPRQAKVAFTFMYNGVALAATDAQGQ